MYKFQIKNVNDFNFQTIARFINNPDHDSMDFIINLIKDTFDFWKEINKVNFSITKFEIDFNNYSFQIGYRKGNKTVYEDFNYRIYKTTIKKDTEFRIKNAKLKNKEYEQK